MDLLKFLKIDEIKGYIEKLDPRERLMVYVGSGVFLGIIFIIVFSWIASGGSGLEKKIKRAEKMLAKVSTLRDEYIQVKEKSEALLETLGDPGGESITTFLEKTAFESGIKIKSINHESTPTYDIYEEKREVVKLENVTLRDLIDFFYKIENHRKLLKIISVRIKPRWRNPAYLDVDFKVSSYLRKE